LKACFRIPVRSLAKVESTERRRPAPITGQIKQFLSLIPPQCYTQTHTHTHILLLLLLLCAFRFQELNHFTQREQLLLCLSLTANIAYQLQRRRAVEYAYIHIYAFLS
jgi:hypothetical protein